jgi:hypothetical protein
MLTEVVTEASPERKAPVGIIIAVSIVVVVLAGTFTSPNILFPAAAVPALGTKYKVTLRSVDV